MDPKYKLIGFGVTVLVAFAFGRYSVKLPPDTKTIDQKTTQTQNQTQTDKHIVTIIQKDCKTGQEVTTITEDDHARQTETQKTVDKLYQTVTQQTRKSTSLGLIGGIQPVESVKPIYGIEVNHEVIGPIYIGGEYLTFGFVGAHIGVNF